MALGQKMKSLKNLKDSLKGGGGGLIRYIPPDGFRARFIQEPEEWVSYQQHYDEVARQGFMCNPDGECDGCSRDIKRTSRYLANAVNLDDNNKVVALMLPKTLAMALVTFYEKKDSLTDRNIEITRLGEGKETTYTFMPEPVDRLNIRKFDPLDLEDVLQQVYAQENGDDTPVAPKKRASSRPAPRTRKPVEPEDDEDDDDDDVAPPARRTPASRTSSRTATAAKPPARRAPAKKAPEPEPEEDEDDDTAYDEDDLRKMTLGELRALAREYGIETRGKAKDDLIDELMEQAEDDEDEPPF